MSKKVLADYNKQFVAENYKQLGPRGCADALLCYTRQDIARLLSLLYHTGCNLWLERKYDKDLTLCKKWPRRIAICGQ